MSWYLKLWYLIIWVFLLYNITLQSSKNSQLTKKINIIPEEARIRTPRTLQLIKEKTWGNLYPPGFARSATCAHQGKTLFLPALLVVFSLKHKCGIQASHSNSNVFLNEDPLRALPAEKCQSWRGYLVNTKLMSELENVRYRWSLFFGLLFCFVR